MVDLKSPGRSRIVALRMTVGRAREIVRVLVADSSNIVWTTHIRERMNERGIDSSDVLNILKKGDIDSAPVDGDTFGELKFKMTKKLSSGREAGVVIVLKPGHLQLVLATTEWEDLK